VLVPNVDILGGEGYGVYSTVTIPPNVVLFGVDGAAGNASLVYSFVGAGVAVFQFASGINRSGIEGLQIIAPSGAPSGRAVSFVASQYNYAKNLQIWYHEIGIDLSDGVTPFSAYNLVEQCEINLSTSYGIRCYQQSNSNTIIGGRIFFTRNVGNTAVALGIVSARGISISGLALEDYNVGLQIGGAPAFSMTGCYFEKGATIPLGADFDVLPTFEESPVFEGTVLFEGNHHADPWPLSPTWWNARQWGALPGNADNSSTLQAVIDYAAANGGAVYIPAGSYDFATPLTNPTCVPIVCLGELVFTGSGAHAVTFGHIAANTVSPSALPSVLKIRRATQDWSDVFSGLRVLNVYELEATVNVVDFECGLLLQGDGFGIAYCQFTIQRLYGNRVGCRFHADNNGWSNENTVRGGRYGTLSATATASPVHGIEFSCDSALSRPNGNKVLDASFELFNTIGYTSAIHGSFTVGTIAGQNNCVENVRIEGTDYWLSGAGLIENVISINYLGPNEGIPADILNGNTTADELVLIQNLFDTNRLIFGSADPTRVGGFSRSNVVAVGANVWRPARGLVWNRTGTALANTTPGTLDSGSITLSNADGMGVLLDFTNVTRDYTRLITLKAIVEATGGRFFCVCWDAVFNLLSGADECSLGFNAGVGYYRSGSDLSPDAAEVAVSFGQNVAYVLAGVASGTAAADIADFEVFALGASDIRMAWGTDIVNSLSTGSPNIAQMDFGDPITNAIPTVPGTPTFYPVGTLARNIAATTSVLQGWIYDGTAWHPSPTAVELGSSTISSRLVLDKPDAGVAEILLRNLGILRWRNYENSSENWLLERYDAAGDLIDVVFQISNSSGLATFNQNVLVNGSLSLLTPGTNLVQGDGSTAGNVIQEIRKADGNSFVGKQYRIGTAATGLRWREEFDASENVVGRVFDTSGNLLAIRPWTFRYDANDGRSGFAAARL